MRKKHDSNFEILYTYSLGRILNDEHSLISSIVYFDSEKAAFHHGLHHSVTKLRTICTRAYRNFFFSYNVEPWCDIRVVSIAISSYIALWTDYAHPNMYVDKNTNRHHHNDCKYVETKNVTGLYQVPITVFNYLALILCLFIILSKPRVLK